MLFILGACDNNRRSDIAVIPVYRQQVLNCNQTFAHMGESWRYQQLQFFISGLEVITADKANQGWQELPLLQTRFQSGKVALLGEVCASDGSDVSEGSWQLQLAPSIDTSDIRRIRFTLGIPFALNHQNPLTQKSPLNLSSMFWVWRTGHKFLRLEMASDKEAWLFHLGSTGCLAPSSVRPPADECRQPNRFQYELAYDSGKGGLLLDLSVLLAQVVLNRESSCKSAPDNPHCRQILANLGAPNSLLFRGEE